MSTTRDSEGYRVIWKLGRLIGDDRFGHKQSYGNCTMAKTITPRQRTPPRKEQRAALRNCRGGRSPSEVWRLNKRRYPWFALVPHVEDVHHLSG